MSDRDDTDIRLGTRHTCDCGWSGYKLDMIDMGGGWVCPNCKQWLIGRGDTLHG